MIGVTYGGAHIEGFILTNANRGVVQAFSTNVGTAWTARNVIVTNVQTGFSIDDVGSRRGIATLTNTWVQCAAGGTGFNTNDANRLTVRNSAVTNCSHGFVGHNHNSFVVDYSLLFNVTTDRASSTPSYLPTFGSHILLATDPQAITATAGSRTLPYFLTCSSAAVDAGDPATAFDDVQFPPSLGTVVNDIGAYGGPGAVLSLSQSEQTSLLVQAGCYLAVEIDINPGPGRNSFKNDGKGVIPVAILGSATFDVNDIDVTTLGLEGLPVASQGRSDRLMARVKDANEDGFNDLVIQVADVPGAFSGSGTATLTGLLLDGTVIAGTDDICLVPPVS